MSTASFWITELWYTPRIYPPAELPKALINPEMPAMVIFLIICLSAISSAIVRGSPLAMFACTILS